jgi:hypothetical protein
MPDNPLGVTDAELTRWTQSRIGAQDTNVPQVVSPPSMPAGDVQNQSTWEQRNAEPGVPLDRTQEPPWWPILHASALANADRQLEFWKRKYGEDKVRVADDGQTIIRVTQDGKPLDIVANAGIEGIGNSPNFATSSGINAYSRLAGSMMAEVVAAGTAGKQVQKLGVKGWKSVPFTAASAAIAMESASALKNLVAEAGGFGKDWEPAAGFAEAASRLPFDFVLGAAFETGAQVGLRILKGPQGKLQVNMDGLANGDYLKLKRAGEEIALLGPTASEAEKKAIWDKYDLPSLATIAEATGYTLAGRVESRQEMMMGGTGQYKDLYMRKLEVIRNLMNRAMGLPSDATPAMRMAELNSARIGEDAMGLFRKNIDPLHDAVFTAEQRAAKESAKAIETKMARSSYQVRQLDPTETGAALREKVLADKTVFDDRRQMLYGALENDPRYATRDYNAPNLYEKAKKLQREFPPKDLAIEELPAPAASPILDPQGRPIFPTEEVSVAKTITGVDPLYTSPKVQRFVNNLIEQKDRVLSLRDLKLMRTTVDDEISKAQAIPGVSTAYLQRVRNMFTDAMDGAIAAIDDPGFKQKWLSANNYYKKNIVRFDHDAIAGILRPYGKGGIGDSAIVEKALTDLDYYKTLRGFVGENSTEHAILKRRMLDKLYSSAETAEAGVIDGKKFVESLKDLYDNRRPIADDILGTKNKSFFDPSTTTFRDNAAALTFIKDSKLPVTDIEDFLAGKRGFNGLRDVAEARKAMEKEYSSDIVKAIGSSRVPGDLKAGEFVERFLNHASYDDTVKAMDLIATKPTLQQSIRAKQIESLFNEAARNPTPADKVSFLLDESRIFNSVKLQNIMSDPARAQKINAILGPEVTADLQAFVKAVRPMEAKQAAYRASAGIAMGMQINEAEKALVEAAKFSSEAPGKISRVVERIGANYIISSLLASGWIRAWARSGRPLTPEAMRALSGYSQASAATVHNLLSDYGPAAGLAADRIKEELDKQYGNRLNKDAVDAASSGQATKSTADRFIEWQRTNAPAMRQR